MKYLILSLFIFETLILSTNNLFSQEYKRSSCWTVGFDPVVKYNFLPTFNIDTLLNPNQTVVPWCAIGNASASISDTTGQLATFTNGFIIYNSDGYGVSNGVNVNCPYGTILSDYYGGFSPFDQTSIILPKKGNTYYVFSSGMRDSIANNFITGIKQEFDVLNYSIVDMDSNGGLGKVVVKNKILLDNQHYLNCALTAVKHGNGRDWWLVKADCLNHQYQTFLVKEDTILGPYYHQIIDNGDFCTYYSQIYFSDDGSKFASSIYGTIDSTGASPFLDYNRVDIYDFDRCNGEFTFKNYYRVPYDTASYPYYDVKSGICFSPDAKLLYMCSWYSVYHIDLEDTNKYNAQFISGPDTTIANFPSYRLMACGPNGKLYIGNFDATRKSMSYVDKPNVKGPGCDFMPQGLWQPYTNLLTPPNMPNYGLGKAPVGGNCWPEVTNDIVANDEIKIYPNPTNNYLHIEFAQPDQKNIIKIFNAVGQLVISTKETIIDISRFSNGIYFVRVGDVVKKVLKE